MKSSLLTISLALLATISVVEAAGWIGQSFTVSGNGNSVNILELNSDGSIASILSSIPINQETITTDLFRCQPAGQYCQFASHDGNGNSYLYNLSDTSGTEIKRTVLSNMNVRSLHVNMQTGISYGTALTNNNNGAIIFQVANGVLSTVLDISKYLNGQTILDGGATHCSDVNNMWVNIYGVKTNGTVLTIALDSQSVSAVTPLQFPGFSGSLWAYCNDGTNQNIVGGNVFTPSIRLLQYGTINKQGQFQSESSITLPTNNPSWVPNGLLSMADQYAYFAAIYPAGTTPSTKTAGVLALFNNNDPNMVLQPIKYNLVGAARFE